MTNIKNIILALLIGLLTGLCAGYYAKGKFTQADQVEAAITQRKEDVLSVGEMRKEETALQTDIRTSQRKIEVIRSEVKKHEITVQPSQGEAAAPSDCRSAVLSQRLVGLLNAARAGSAPDTAAWSDGEGATAADFEVGRNHH